MPSRTDIAIAAHVVAMSAILISIITQLMEGGLQRSTKIYIFAVRRL